jgi:hypothetical protein
MRALRPSLESLLTFVAIAAVDLAMALTAIRAAHLGSHTHGEMAPGVFVLGVPLMTGLLVAYLVIMLWGLWQRGECHAFLVGFEVFGWGTLFLYLACFVWTNGWSDLVPRYINTVLSPVSATLLESRQTSSDSAAAIAAVIVCMPMLFIALIGGILSSRLRITVVVRPQCDGERVPAQVTFPVGPWRRGMPTTHDWH